MLRARSALLLVAVLSALAFDGLPPTASDFVGGPSAVSVADVYRSVENELRRHDGIYQTSVQVSSDFGMLSYSGTITRWADVHRDASREESDMTPFGSAVMITTHDGRHARDATGRIITTPSRYWTCNGVGVAASAVLGCPGPTERGSAEVREGTHDGRPAVVLVTAGSISGSDETYTFTRRLFLDPSTYLPIALDGGGQFDFGRIMPARERYRYTHRFIPSETVARDLFDPASIGSVSVDPAQVLGRGPDDLRVSWLGTEFAAASALPALVLSKVDAPGSGPGYRYLLYYAPRDDRFAPPIVSLQLWPRAAWDATLGASRLANVWDDPCWSHEELSLPSGKAVIFSGFSGVMSIGAAPGGPCPSRAYDTFLAHVYLADSVVFVSAPGASGFGGTTKSPYDTHDGIQALVLALRQR